MSGSGGHPLTPEEQAESDGGHEPLPGEPIATDAAEENEPQHFTAAELAELEEYIQAQQSRRNNSNLRREEEAAYQEYLDERFSDSRRREISRIEERRRDPLRPGIIYESQYTPPDPYPTPEEIEAMDRLLLEEEARLRNESASDLRRDVLATLRNIHIDQALYPNRDNARDNELFKLFVSIISRENLNATTMVCMPELNWALEIQKLFTQHLSAHMDKIKNIMDDRDVTAYTNIIIDGFISALDAVGSPENFKADKLTQSTILDKIKDYPYMCDELITSTKNHELAAYINRLLNEKPGESIQVLEPILTFSALSKMYLNPVESDSSGDEVVLRYSRNGSAIKAFSDWLVNVDKNPRRRLVVKYEGQAGIDIGGLRKAFMSELAQEIKQKYCESVFKPSLVCRVKQDTSGRISNMKSSVVSIPSSIEVEGLMTGEAPRIISQTTNNVGQEKLSVKQRQGQINGINELLREETSIKNRIAKINFNIQRYTRTHKRVQGEVSEQVKHLPGKVAGSRRSSKKKGSMSAKRLAEPLKASISTNKDAVVNLTKFQEEKDTLQEELIKVQDKIRKFHVQELTVNNSIAAGTKVSRHQPAVNVHDINTNVSNLLKSMSSIRSRLSMIQAEKMAHSSNIMKLSKKIDDKRKQVPITQRAGSRRSIMKKGSKPISAKSFNMLKHKTAKDTMSKLEKEELELRDMFVAVNKKLKLAYTMRDMEKPKTSEQTSELINLFDTMKKQIFASEPQRFNFRVTSKTDAHTLERLNGVIDTISSALFRHIVKDSVITGQTLSFGLLRLPAVYILTLASLCKPKNAQYGSLYDLLRVKVSDLTPKQSIAVCELYNMCVKLDCETFDQVEEYALTAEQMKVLLSSQKSMLDYLKVKEEMYFGNMANKRLVLNLFKSVYDKLSLYICINSDVWTTNLNGMNLFRVFMPCFSLSADDLLNVIYVNHTQILKYNTRDTEILKIIKMIVSLIREQEQDGVGDNLLSFIRNVTGGLSLPSKIAMNIDNMEYAAWNPVMMYHTCFNSVDIRVSLLRASLLRSEEELKETLRNYLFGDHSGNMGSA